MTTFCKTPSKRELRLTKWSDKTNDYRHVKTLYRDWDEPIPDTIDYDNHEYKQGQVSGSQRWIVWYDCD